jgi:ABC-2 type transport system permease protein
VSAAEAGATDEVIAVPITPPARPPWPRLLAAFVRRDFRIERTYRVAFLAQLGGAFTTLVSAGFLSRLVPGHQQSLTRYGSDYFTFVLVGTASLAYFTVALGSFSSGLDEEQQQGTLEPLLASPNDPRILLLFGAAWPFLFATAQLIAYLVAGDLLFRARFASTHLLLAAAVLLLTVVAFSAVGLAASSLMLLSKRTGPVVSLIAAAFALLGGVLYPISVLPRPLQFLAEALPMSHGLDGVRRALVAHLDVGAIVLDVAVLAAFSVVLLPLALQGFRWAVDRARRQGSLGHY